MRPVLERFQHNARSNVELIPSRSPLRESVEKWVMRPAPPELVARQLGHQHELEASLLAGFELGRD